MPKSEKADVTLWCRPTSHQLLRVIAALRGEKLCETLDVLVRREEERMGLLGPETPAPL